MGARKHIRAEKRKEERKTNLLRSLNNVLLHHENEAGC